MSKRILDPNDSDGLIPGQSKLMDDTEGPMFMIPNYPKAIKDEKGSPWAIKVDKEDNMSKKILRPGVPEVLTPTSSDELIPVFPGALIPGQSLGLDEEDGPHYCGDKKGPMFMIPVPSKGMKGDKKGPIAMRPDKSDDLIPGQSDGLIPTPSDGLVPDLPDP